MTLSTYDKALELNLDPQVYGTFAEIGAGQETANWFFRASGTAGLMAKTISAYDMTMSDAIYGQATRYVSESRLAAMLEHEYSILIERLGPKRGAETTFFSFCNTVRARGYKDSGECHGWLGIRYQLKPGDPPSDLIAHVRLLDDSTMKQMEALGVVGVNMIHSAFRHKGHLRNFVESLLDNLSTDRIEVDLLKFSGHGYGYFDNRLCALQLVESGLTEAAMILPSGECVQPAEALYKRPVMLLRGSFNPVTNLHMAMLDHASRRFDDLLDEASRSREVELCEITVHNLLRGDGMDPVAFIDRADALQALGKTVLVSSCAEFHRIAAFLNRCTQEPIGIVLSIGLLNELFKPKWSENLAGGLLESFGRLFKDGVTLLVFPWKNRKSGELVTVENFHAPADSSKLYEYFLETRRILGVEPGDESLLALTGRDVLQLIELGDATWRMHVPLAAQAVIERHARGR